MYEYKNNILSIPAKLLYKEWKLFSYESFKTHLKRGKFVNTNPGTGREAWVSFHDLPVINGVNIEEFCFRALGDPKEILAVNKLEEWILPDSKAIDFFALHRKPNGKPLTFDQQREKATNCCIMNAIETLLNDRVKCNKVFGKKKTKIWKNISDAVNNLDSKKWKYNLPANHKALKRRYNEYVDNRYLTFIHKGEGSYNARIVSKRIENLIIALYCLPNKPSVKRTHDTYLQFMGGALDVFDIQTGEIFNREDFFNDNDQPVELSESTIWNYINKPKNQIIIAKYRNGDYDFNQKVRPHVNRHAPNYSMSKITLDDRDIMHTKLHNGVKVKAYYAFDVLSGAMIGIAHSKKKTHELYINCLRNMFRFTISHNLGVPMQMEVERHLVSDFSDGIMKAGELFPFVRWCNPTNSQEKFAERLIQTKKYGVEKNAHQNVGRHYARRDSNRITRQKIFDEENDNYKEAKASYEQIVAWELEEQQDYNNELHPNQRKFKGKTRLQVFLENVNPNLPKLNKALLSKYIGVHRETSVRRNQYVIVNYQKYQLSNPNIVGFLSPNNKEVDAYFMPINDDIEEVYIYQNGNYIDTCRPTPEFNTANSEWTDQDVEKYDEALDYIRKFDKMTKDLISEKVSKLGTDKKRIEPIEVDVEIVETNQTEDDEYREMEHQTQRERAINDL